MNFLTSWATISFYVERILLRREWYVTSLSW